MNTDIIPIVFISINSILSGIGFLTILETNGKAFFGDFIFGFFWICLSVIFQINLLLYQNLKGGKKDERTDGD